MDFIKKYSTGFTMITNTILQDKDLSLRAKGLYTYLFSKPDGWEFHISAMVKELKETEGQIRVIVQELLNKGYIVRHQVNENGKFGGMVYEFVDIDRDGKNRITDIPCSEKSAYGKTPTHNNTESTSNTDYISNTEVNNTPISNKLDITPTDLYQDFEGFWELYPRQRRGNKQKAYKAYLRVLKEKRSTPEQLLIAVNKYAKSEEVSRGYAKGCEAWLNDDRFNTDYDKKVKKYMTKQEQQDEMFRKFLSEENTEQEPIFDIKV